MFIYGSASAPFCTALKLKANNINQYHISQSTPNDALNTLTL